MTISLYPPVNAPYSTANAPWYMQVGRGLVPGATSINVYGYSETAPSGIYGAVWEGSTSSVGYTPPSAAGVPVYASTSSETITLLVTGTDSSYNLVTDTVTFAGSTTGTATSGQSFFRINSMRLQTGINAGTITAKISTVTYARINAGTGQTQMSIYTVPLGYTFYLLRAQVYANNNGSQYTTYRVSSNIVGTGPQVELVNSPFFADYLSLRVVPRSYAQKTDIQWQVNNSGINGHVGVQVEGVLISNTAP